MGKRVAEPYYPSVPPQEFAAWPNWINQELHRLSHAINQLATAVAVRGNDVPVDITIDPPDYVPIGIGDEAIFEEPAGHWDPVTALYTVQQDGTYLAFCDLTVAPFGVGNQTYYVSIQILNDGIPGFTVFGSGTVDVPVSATLAIPLSLRSPQTLGLQVACVTENVVDVSTYNYGFAFTRLHS